MSRHWLITAPDKPDVFWRPNRLGYTNTLAEAGIYPEDVAKHIEAGGRGDKAHNLSEYADRLREESVLAQKHVELLTMKLKLEKEQ